MLRYMNHDLHLSSEGMQTGMFLQLVVAGHLLLFATRSRRFFFQPPLPESRFFLAIMGTQVFAALMAANGWLVTAISWHLIGVIWLYNLAWLGIADLVKLGLYRGLDLRETRQLGWQRRLHQRLDSFRGLHAK